ncbi:type III-A CRISPR-associated RAMP protein Csm4 [Methylolobus aquaticus]
MHTLRFTLIPRSAFGSPLLGDTLFGQLCWAVRNRYGESRLIDLLKRYQQEPYVVVSDALPRGHWPRPALPAHWFAIADDERKATKRRAWLPIECFHEPVEHWLAHSKASDAVPGGTLNPRLQPHNTLNRETGTTGEGQFAPYTMEQLWFAQAPGKNSDTRPADVELDVYVVLDEAQLSADELSTVIDDIGAIGFGRDASIGLGKFERAAVDVVELPCQHDADAWLTLAPCAPQGQGLDALRSFYQPFTRFGRHGDIGVHSGNPFKTPVLLARTGAVLTPATFRWVPFIGRGLGGDGSLSKSIPGTVQQGYAPVVGIRLPQGVTQ